MFEGWTVRSYCPIFTAKCTRRLESSLYRLSLIPQDISAALTAVRKCVCAPDFFHVFVNVSCIAVKSFHKFLCGCVSFIFIIHTTVDFNLHCKRWWEKWKLTGRWKTMGIRYCSLYYNWIFGCNTAIKNAAFFVCSVQGYKKKPP
jgi:hypothetical protein